MARRLCPLTHHNDHHHANHIPLVPIAVPDPIRSQHRPKACQSAHNNEQHITDHKMWHGDRPTAPSELDKQFSKLQSDINTLNEFPTMPGMYRCVRP